MARQPLNTGTAANDGTGDTLRAGAQKIEANFTELYAGTIDRGAVLAVKGNWDASAGTFPGGAGVKAGDEWYVSVAGTVDGIPFQPEDSLRALINAPSAATFAGNWRKIDGSDRVLSVAGLTGAPTAQQLAAAMGVRKVYPSDIIPVRLGKLQAPVDDGNGNATTYPADQLVNFEIAGKFHVGGVNPDERGDEVIFSVRVDDPRLVGSTYPRIEFRAVNLDGSDMAFDPTTPQWALVMEAKVRWLELPGTKPSASALQLKHSDGADEYQLNLNGTTVRLDLGGSSVTVMTGYVLGQTIDVTLVVAGGKSTWYFVQPNGTLVTHSQTLPAGTVHPKWGDYCLANNVAGSTFGTGGARIGLRDFDVRIENLQRSVQDLNTALGGTTWQGGGGSVTLSDLTLSAASLYENLTSGTGVASILGAQAGSTLTLADDAGNQFAIQSGALVAGTTNINYEDPAHPTHTRQIVINESNPNANPTTHQTTLVLNILDVSGPSVSTPIADQNHTVGATPSATSAAAAFSIPPGQTPVFTAVLPSWGSINPATGVITWSAPGAAQSGFAASVTCTTGEGAATDNFVVNAAAAGDTTPPSITAASLGTLSGNTLPINITISEASNVDMVLVNHNPTGITPPQVAAHTDETGAAPAGSTVLNVAASGTVNYTVPNGLNGNYYVALSPIDGAGNRSATVTILGPIAIDTTASGPTFLGIVKTYNNNAPSLAAALPSGLQVGDRAVIVLASTDISPTTPAGWTLKHTFSNVSATEANLYVYTRTIDGSEGATVTLTASNWKIMTAVAFAYRGGGGFGVGAGGTPTYSVYVNASGTLDAPRLTVAAQSRVVTIFARRSDGFSGVAGADVTRLTEATGAEDIRVRVLGNGPLSAGQSPLLTVTNGATARQINSMALEVLA